jgi:DNA invertase Pin-like site-specific DNA recombinase
MSENRGRPIDPETQSRLTRLLRNGTPLRAIARLCKVDRNTVRKYARALGFTTSQQSGAQCLPNSPT